MSISAPAPDLLGNDELDEVSRRGLALYDEKLRSLLEPEHGGEVVAIHVDTGDYAVARNSPLARRELRARRPEGMILTVDIGPVEALDRSARWLLASPSLLSRQSK